MFSICFYYAGKHFNVLFLASHYIDKPLLLLYHVRSLNYLTFTFYNTEIAVANAQGFESRTRVDCNRDQSVGGIGGIFLVKHTDFYFPKIMGEVIILNLN